MKRLEHSRSFAKKSLGQNFLTDFNIIKKIVDAVDPSAMDTIIEIGPGRGALTERLVGSGAEVIAIELDRNLVPYLRETFASRSNVQVVEGDALDVNLETILSASGRPANGNAKVVANLPYYISTAILKRLSEQRHFFSELILMFQREVVERIAAEPGDSARGYLTVIVEACFDVEKLFDVPPEAFLPVPKVWSSVVRLTPKRTQNYNEAAFRNIVSTAFSQKRKTILNNLRASLSNADSHLARAGIDAKRRAESLTLDEWVKLTQSISASAGTEPHEGG